MVKRFKSPEGKQLIYESYDRLLELLQKKCLERKEPEVYYIKKEESKYERV